LEEILKISELLKRKELPHKKPAGLEDIDFPSTAHDPPENNKGEFFNVLSFPKNQDEGNDEKKFDEETQIEPQLSTESELFLLQLEFSKHNEETCQRLNALKEYKKSSDVLQVKKTTIDGKAVRKSIPTNGILINKKQA